MSQPISTVLQRLSALLLTVFALVPATLSAQTLDGDMNHDGRLTVEDIALLVKAVGEFKAPHALPYHSDNLASDDWTILSITDSNPWVQGSAYTQATGYQAWDSSKKTNREVEGYLLSPAFSTFGITGNVEVSFDDVVRYTGNDSNYRQHIKLYVSSTSDGTSFNSDEWEALDWTPSHVRNDWTLTNTTLTLPERYAGCLQVRLAIYFYAPATGSTTFELANFTISEASAPSPDALNANVIDSGAEYVASEIGTSSSHFIHRLEMPRLQADETFVVHQDTELSGAPLNFSVGYVASKHHSRWVAFRFDDIMGQNLATRSGSGYPADPLVSTTLSKSAKFPSGYDHGHLCASADRVATTTGNVQTFYMTNMSPQLAYFNQHYWTKYESHVQSLGRDCSSAASAFADTLYVVKGGTIDAPNYSATAEIDGYTVPIPDYYFMALLKVKDGVYSAVAFWMEHRAYDSSEQAATKTEEILNHCISIDELEARTGIDFFCNLPAEVETAVEATFSAADWRLQ